MATLVWNVLLVDDSPEYLYIFENAASDLHLPIMVHSVDSALEAINFLSKQGQYLGRPTPDLIISDLNMPKMSGLQLLETLKKSTWKDIPIVIHSTTARPSEFHAARALGAVEFWTKPGTLEDLMAQIPRVLKFIGHTNVEGSEGFQGA